MQHPLLIYYISYTTSLINILYIYIRTAKVGLLRWTSVNKLPFHKLHRGGDARVIKALVARLNDAEAALRLVDFGGFFCWEELFIVFFNDFAHIPGKVPQTSPNPRKERLLVKGQRYLPGVCGQNH